MDIFEIRIPKKAIKFFYGFLAGLLFAAPLSFLSAQVMGGSGYQIYSDSLNTGGRLSSSTNYTIEDTLGEVGSGDSSSASYSLYAGFQQMQQVYVSVGVSGNVTMSPTLSGLTGGTANGSTLVTVITDAPAGYSLTLRAESSPALTSGSDTIADYTPAGAVPDYSFSALSFSSEFAFTVEGSDSDTRYRDNGSQCGVGSQNTTDTCWDALSTSDRQIAVSTVSNHPSGATTSIKFRTYIGSLRNQPPGAYTATTTVTVVSL